MNTLQHSALYIMAKYAKSKDNIRFNGNRAFEEALHQELPFVLLPDGIRAYVNSRPAGHFEQTPDKTGNSWMVYPDKYTLKKLTKETASEKIRHYAAKDLPKCAIGEMANINDFDHKNWGHQYYHQLRAHMLQDYVLDSYVRTRFFDNTHRFEDRFTLREERAKVLDGQTLRQQLQMFERLGFVYLAGKTYERTRIIMDNEWLKTHILPALEAAYPKDLAKNTFDYMILSDETDERIRNKSFAFTDEEKRDFILTTDLEGALDEMCAEAYRLTFEEI